MRWGSDLVFWYTLRATKIFVVENNLGNICGRSVRSVGLSVCLSVCHSVSCVSWTPTATSYTKPKHSITPDAFSFVIQACDGAGANPQTPSHPNF